LSTTTHYDWIRQISPELKQLDAIPLWGHPPPFPLKQLSVELAKVLQLNSLEIEIQDTRWREEKELADGLGENPHFLTYTISPLQGKAYWALPKAALKSLMQLLFAKTDLSTIEDPFIDGFYRFLGVEAANAFQKIDFDRALSPALLALEEPPKEPCLSMDIAFTLLSERFEGRLLLSQEMMQAFKGRYAQKKLSVPLVLYEKVEVTLQLLAGSTSIKKDEWRSTAAGDILVLDSCTLLPGEDKGRIMLALNGMPIFRGKIKDGNIKILEYPLFHEVQTTMSDKDFDEEDIEPVEESDFDFEEESEEETTEEEHEEEEDFSLEEHTEEEYEDTEAEETEEEVEEEEIPTPVKKELKAPPAPMAKTPEQAKAAPLPPPVAPSKATEAKLKEPQPVVNIEEIPITISIEVGRLQMTLQKLSELQPGNLLELDVHPENGVDLVVNGKCIGKGELLRIGEVLGVRILDKI